MASADDAGRYALIDADGVVQNVCLWDGNTAWTPPDGCSAVALSDDDHVGRGDTYDGAGFTRQITANVPAPQAVTVDPQALADAQTQIAAATTVAGLRRAVAAALDLLTPTTY